MNLAVAIRPELFRHIEEECEFFKDTRFKHRFVGIFGDRRIRRSRKKSNFVFELAGRLQQSLVLTRMSASSTCSTADPLQINVRLMQPCLLRE